MQDTNKQSNYPKFINVEIMDICNLKCSHCYIENWDNHDGFMDYNLFEKLIERLSDMLKHAQSFDCSSVEGLFHKSIFDMFDFSVTPCIFIHFRAFFCLFFKYF